MHLKWFKKSVLLILLYMLKMGVHCSSACTLLSLFSAANTNSANSSVCSSEVEVDCAVS